MDFPFIFSFILWVIIPLLILNKSHKLLFFIGLCSFYTDFFFVDVLGFQFRAVSWIAFCYLLLQRDKFIFNSNSIIIKPFYLEWLFMLIVGFYFVFFNPWDDPHQFERLPTQRLPIRTLVSLIRFLELILTFSYFYYVFKKGIISINYFIKSVYFIILTSIIVGVLDLWFFGGVIRKFLIPDHYALSRFTGLTGEPRGIGQYCTLSVFIFLTIGVNSEVERLKIISSVGIFLSLFGIALSYSSTAIGLTFICLFIFFLMGQLHIKYIIGAILIGYVGFQILKNDDKFIEHQQKRLAVVALEKTRSTIRNVPKVFNAFEVFDKSALTFLYFNPQYLLFGVGPNTVNIPASKYLSPGDKIDYKGAIDSVPINFFVNVLSRSGLIGVSIYLFSFIYILYRLKKLENKNYFKLLLLFLIYLLFYVNYFFYAVLGIILGSYEVLRQKKTE